MNQDIIPQLGEILFLNPTTFMLTQYPEDFMIISFYSSNVMWVFGIGQIPLHYSDNMYMKSVFHLCLYLFHNLPRTHFLFWKSHKQQHVCYHQGLLWKISQGFIRDFELSHNLKILHISYFMRLCHTNVKWILLFANTGAVVLIKELLFISLWH